MAKALRMAIMEKHHLVDSAERSQLQKCLDMIQKSIKVTSMQSMIERLDTITRQQGLMFTTGPGGQECFISSDMFYVEVLLEPSGTVNDVKISHHGDPLSCPELTQVLLRGDFAEFTKHLEGLASIYQLNADKKTEDQGVPGSSGLRD
uniref:Mediator of RNA polymerase II transcription subunit 1 n=1 Tax=Rhipicephalus appendiculatus TaxID=34631 RepID=A0A131YXA5_RHIAP